MSSLQAAAPCMPSWVVAKRYARVQIYEQFLNCTGFIGFPTERGFSVSGTCFFVCVEREELDFAYAVTCRHVINANSNSPGLHIRVNRKGKSPKAIPIENNAWIKHPDPKVDVAICHFDFNRHDQDEDLDVGVLSKGSIATEETAKHYGLSAGIEVFIIGAFVGRIGENRNIPIVRSGNIAAMPLEPVWPYSPTRPAYLVETRSLGGISGSPLFLHTAPERLHGGPIPLGKNEGRIVLPYLLVGMIISNHAGQYREDFVSDDPNQILLSDADFNAGISVAVPVDQILEVLNLPSVEEARQISIAAKMRETGARNA